MACLSAALLRYDSASRGLAGLGLSPVPLVVLIAIAAWAASRRPGGFEALRATSGLGVALFGGMICAILILPAWFIWLGLRLQA